MSFGGLGSFFSGIMSPVGGLLNGLTGVTDQQDRTYRQQQEAMRDQNKYNLAMWNLQNEYNSPASQLARMREAGVDINPTSYALGTGNLSNTAAHIDSASGFAGSGSPAGNPISMAMGVASGLQGIDESNQRIDNMKEQNTNLMQEGLNLITRGTGMRLQNQSQRLNNAIARHNLKYGKKYNKPVGYVSSVYNDPIGYAGQYAGETILSMMGK